MAGFGRMCAAMLASLGVSLAALAADDFKLCVRCHGADGNSPNASAPSIAGMDPGYAEATWAAYKDGSRPCGMAEMKCRMAAKLTGEEITAAAEHFGAGARVAAEQEFDPALAEKGKALHEAHCHSCHGKDPEVPWLRGQWRKYLEYSLEHYQNGTRQQPQEMADALGALAPGDLDALLHFYASGQ